MFNPYNEYNYQNIECNNGDDFQTLQTKDNNKQPKGRLIILQPQQMLETILAFVIKQYVYYWVHDTSQDSVTGRELTVADFENEKIEIHHNMPRNKNSNIDGARAMLKFLRAMVKLEKNNNFHQELVKLISNHILNASGNNKKIVIKLAILHCVKVIVREPGKTKPAQDAVLISELPGFAQLHLEEQMAVADRILLQIMGKIASEKLNLEELIYLLPGKCFQSTYLIEDQVSIEGKRFRNETPKSYELLNSSYRCQKEYQSKFETNDDYHLIVYDTTVGIIDTFLAVVKSDYMEFCKYEEAAVKDEELIRHPERGRAIENLGITTQNIETISELPINKECFYYGKALYAGTSIEGQHSIMNLMYELKAKTEENPEDLRMFLKGKAEEYAGTRRAKVMTETFRKTTPLEFDKLNSNRGPIFISKTEQLKSNFIEYIHFHYMQTSGVEPQSGPTWFNHRIWNGMTTVDAIKANRLWARPHRNAKNIGPEGVEAVKELLLKLCKDDIDNQETFAEVLLDHSELWDGEHRQELIYEFMCKNTAIRLLGNNQFMTVYDCIKAKFDEVNKSEARPFQYSIKKQLTDSINEAGNIILCHLSERLLNSQPNICQFCRSINDKVINIFQEDINNLSDFQKFYAESMVQEKIVHGAFNA